MWGIWDWDKSPAQGHVGQGSSPTSLTTKAWWQYHCPPQRYEWQILLVCAPEDYLVMRKDYRIRII